MLEGLTTNSSPILVTGMPRSGTTFLQRLLSSHPEITISGQEPQGVRWGEWLQTLIDGVAFTRRSNEEFQDTPGHYACGIDEATAAERFLKFIQEYLVGEVPTERWGLKSLTNCRTVPDAIRGVWPGTRWVVCVRDPFRSMESLRNTFDRDGQISWSQMCEWWTDAARFARENSDAMLIQVDRLESFEARRSMAVNLFEFIGEEPTEAVWEFVAEWPLVHKVVPDINRRFSLNHSQRRDLFESDSEFKKLAMALGYLDLRTEVEAI